MKRKCTVIAALLLFLSATSSWAADPSFPRVYPGATPDPTIKKCKTDEKEGRVIVGCYRTDASVDTVGEFYAGLTAAGPCHSVPACTFAKGIYEIDVWSQDMHLEENRVTFIKANIEIYRCDQLLREGKIIRTGCKPAP